MSDKLPSVRMPLERGGKASREFANYLEKIKRDAASSPTFVTVDLTGITDSNIPYMGGAGFADSPLTTDGTDVTNTGNLVMPEDGTVGASGLYFTFDDSGNVVTLTGGGLSLPTTLAFTGATTVNQIKMPDNLADALSVLQGANPYMTFVTTDDLEDIVFSESVDIIHTAIAAGEHGLEVDLDAANYGNVKAIDIDYITGTIGLGQDEGIILINIDESQATTGADVFALEVLATEGDADIYGLKAGALVGPVHQDSGTFANMDSALVNAVNKLTAFTTSDPGGANNVEMFSANADTVTIGDAAKFEELEFLLETVASGGGIKPTFHFSTGAAAWTAFTPTDGTDGMRRSGVIAWDDADIPTWAVSGAEYLIRITRTRNVLTTPPVEDKVQIAAVTEYIWDKNGDVSIKGLTLAGNIVLPANGVIGVTDGNPQIVFDNANNWLEITEKVGIGTASPGAQLEVVSASNVGARVTTSGISRFDLYTTAGGDTRNWALKTSIVAEGDVSLMRGTSAGANPSVHVLYADKDGNVSIDNIYAGGHPWFDVVHYGADPTGVAECSAEIQAAIDAAGLVTGARGVVFFPAGVYLIDTTLDITAAGFHIMGAGMGASYIYTVTNIPMIDIQVDQAQQYYCAITDIGFIGNVSGTRTSNSGILISGTTTNYLAYSTFQNLLFLGTYHGIYVSKVTDIGGEAAFDWNNFINIKTTNYLAYNVEHAILFENGSGTGNVFANSNLVFNVSGIEWKATNGANVGDITINGIQMGGNGTGVKGATGAAYRSNINITGCQFDAGVDTALDLQTYFNVHVQATNWGGATVNDLAGSATITGDFAGAQETRWGFSDTGIAQNGAANLFNLTMHTDYKAVLLEIVSSGYMKGQGTAITTSTYHVQRNATGAITVTQLNTDQTLTGTGKITHSTSVAANVITFIGTIVSTAADSDIATALRVVGAYYEVEPI